MAQNSNDVQAAIATNRFGLGARPGEIDQAKADPKAFLLSQIRAEGADQPSGPQQSSRQILADFYAYRRERQQLRKEGISPKQQRAARLAGAQPQAMADQAAPGADMSAMAAQAPAPRPLAADATAQAAEFRQAQRQIQQGIGKEFLARTQLGCTTPAGFRERWALFWFNHFTVSAVKQVSGVVTGAFEREAIRPRVFGRFEDLLLASSRHPAMLLYLDQAQSLGPDSMAARFRKVGLNENLAREIMELHTVGPASGYKQADVTEFARAMTGWSVGGPRGQGTQGAFNYLDRGHEPGSRVVMGKRYGDSGERQAREIMVDLAANPFTAKRISRKLAVHFVSDDPPQKLVDRLSEAWIGSQGRLDVVARTLVESPEAWDPQPHKFKTPYEFVVSGYRAVGAQPAAIEQLQILNLLGQKPFSAPSPKGWDDVADGWSSPDGIIKRLEYAKSFSARIAPTLDPIATAHSALGASMGERTEKAVTRAESKSESLALLLMSPEFLRR